MNKTFPIFLQPMSATTINEATGEASVRHMTWYMLPEEVRQRLEPMLTPYGYTGDPDEYPNADSFLSRVEFACRYQLKRPPWLIVFYPEEYPLLGHLMSVRANSQDIRCSAYSIMRRDAKPFDPSVRIAPPMSVLWILSKKALEEVAASRSPVIAGVFESLRELPEDGSWVHFADPIDPAWVASAATADSELFFRYSGI